MALNWDGLGNSWSFWSCNWDVEKMPFNASGKGESKGFPEAVSDDIVDKLPVDPFGMEIRSTLIGWIQDFENDFGSDFCAFGVQDGDEKKMADQQHLFKGLNWVWNGSMMSFQQHGGNSNFNFNEYGSTTVDDLKGLNWVLNSTMSFQEETSNFEINEISIPDHDFNGLGFVFSDEGKGMEEDHKVGVCCDDNEVGAPHDGLFFTLGYLGVKDLLAVERVCRPLRDAVRGDPLLWRSIHVEPSLSKRMTDDDLFKLSSRAQGTLKCLSVVGCAGITDGGLKRVLETNPNLTKLSVPDCTRLTVEGILSNLRAFRSAGSSRITHLRIGGRSGLTEQQFKELKFLVGVDNPKYLGGQKPQFFGQGQLHLMCDDDRAIDIEVCPRCQKLKLVYDCPSESCRRTNHASQLCRACILCISRCIRCGCCLKDCDYEETFTLDLLCFNCWTEIISGEEKSEVKSASSSKHTIFHQETMYRFCFYG